MKLSLQKNYSLGNTNVEATKKTKSLPGNASYIQPPTMVPGSPASISQMPGVECVPGDLDEAS
ncbi:MAG: hypothetical protein WA224_12920, partial [Candidatus Acidiferrales bacterium]